MKNKVILDADEIIDLYVNQKRTINSIAEEKHVGKLKIQNLLKEHNIPFRKKGELLVKHGEFITDYHVKKYVPKEGKTFIAKCKVDGKEFNDYENSGGFLTSYIRNTLGIEVPSLAKRNVYYMETGNYWYEQYFNIIEIDEKPTIKCPYCEWETTDIENKSGMMLTHIQKEHGKTVDIITKEHPELLEYFKKYKRCLEKKERLLNKDNYVTCPICGEKLEKLTFTHLTNKHGYKTYGEFKADYPNFDILSQSMREQALDAFKLGNLTLPKQRFISSYEREIQEFLESFNIEFSANRQILQGQEIDILIPSKHVAIEFNELHWHSEYFDKKKGVLMKGRSYHLNKTKLCAEHGYNLIHIFEDEFIEHKEIVFDKIKHLLKINTNNPKINGRDCVIREITKETSKNFLESHHIQGFTSATVYLGAYWNDMLVGVMNFKCGNVRNPNWELVRCATHIGYLCRGLVSKMFQYFVRNYNPQVIVSFADRRWTHNQEDNVYVKLGFELESITPPDYRYYNRDVDKFKRIHKMSFNKKTLIKKYGLDPKLTESEMAKILGYKRIWDCGLFKYVWHKED